jgi:hypothetical protein
MQGSAAAATATPLSCLAQRSDTKRQRCRRGREEGGRLIDSLLGHLPSVVLCVNVRGLPDEFLLVVILLYCYISKAILQTVNCAAENKKTVAVIMLEKIFE